MVGVIAIAIGLVTAASTSALHPRLRLHPVLIAGVGVLGGWAGSYLFASPWLPAVNHVDAAARIAGAATGGIVAAAIAVVAVRLTTGQQNAKR